ncbi:FKBP-type peptidyl-prolyl cis-trans isomerase [Sulfurisoma sediminicola]|uniref:Peptidyl-prolyl cis-trans isomerase n=1 Tax=Sulfurisoma sediminicola TaxID=1381557 RepID=A0A497XB97_9PROT|nr:FKBP-type peptidyl-prolyl cis-trans isomerase [Sulfurisoma sediminicola]RLJ63590.1 FKBP-type peptidyl-prolyl cis-trans isomerase SlpA [Sulfurisoma sediminicola]
MNDRVKADSLLTLHYRLATADDTELVSTFAGNPSTLQLGNGELAPTLEACLDGLPVGEHHVFLLEPQQAFGQYSAQLVKRFARDELPQGAAIELHGAIEFEAPGGGKYVGTVRELDETSALIDFNHPLAGKFVRFEVKIIGVL